MHSKRKTRCITGGNRDEGCFSTDGVMLFASRFVSDYIIGSFKDLMEKGDITPLYCWRFIKLLIISVRSNSKSRKMTVIKVSILIYGPLALLLESGKIG